MIDGTNEGLIGTEAGTIHYVNFMDNVCIKLVHSNNQNQDAVPICQIDMGNNHPPLCGNIFVTSCGVKSDEFKSSQMRSAFSTISGMNLKIRPDPLRSVSRQPSGTGGKSRARGAACSEQ